MSGFSFISPFFIVSNIENSISFYVDKLGFEVWYKGPETEPFFAMVGSGPVSLMLKAAGVPAPNHTRHSWARWDAFISVPDPDALFEKYRSAGVSFHQPIRDDGDGLRGFEVADTDGYVLFFGRTKA